MVVNTILYSFLAYQDSGRNPVYKVGSKGYRQRFKEESDPKLMELSYNCGEFIEDTAWNYGIFVAEYNNKIQNLFQTAKSSHHLLSALQEIRVAKAVINYKTYKQHISQKNRSTIHKQKFPNCKTHMEKYPEVFEELAGVYKSLFNLAGVKSQFHVNKNNKYMLMADSYVIEQIAPLLYSDIIKNNIKLNKDKKWNEKLTFACHALIQKNKMKEVNTKNLKIIREALQNAGWEKLSKNTKLLQEKLSKMLKNYNNRIIIH